MLWINNRKKGFDAVYSCFLDSFILQGAQLLAVKLTCANMENCSLKGINLEDPLQKPANLEGWSEAISFL